MRPRLIPVHVSEAEHATAKALAAAERVTLSEWARRRLFPVMLREPTPAEPPAVVARPTPADELVSGAFAEWIAVNGLGGVKFGRTVPSVAAFGRVWYASIEKPRVYRIVDGCPCTACGYGPTREAALEDYKQQLAGRVVEAMPYRQPKRRIQCPEVWDAAAAVKEGKDG